jgi:probable addiction module antidote protein
MMLTIKHDTKPWYPAEALNSDEAQLAYLALTLEEDDPAAFTEALGVVARARGMTQLAGEIGTGRNTLYKGLRRGGNPSFATIIHVLHALGIDIRFARHGTSAPSEPSAHPNSAAVT